MINNLYNKYNNSKLGQQKKSVQFVLIIILFIILWFIIGILFGHKKAEEVKQPSIVNVDVETLKQKSIVSNIIIYGQTKASEKITLKSRTSGIVEKIYKHKGEYVKKGETIFKLKIEDRNEKLNAAIAMKQKAEIAYKTAENLLNQNLISKMDFISSKASFEEANATVSKIRLDIDYTNIKAPFDGIVDDLFVEEGGYVSSMTRENEIGTFVNLDPVKISADIPEKYINRISKGVVAKVTLSNNSIVDGLLTYIGSVANTSTRTFNIELEANNKDMKIVEGMTAEISLPLNSIFASKLSVSSCLTFGDDGSIGVKTINDKNIVGFYPVEIVKEEDKGLWVSGLPNIANVIIGGGEFVKIGNKVNPKFINNK